MSVAVDFHVDLLMETFATVRTNEWSVVGVSAHVRVQVGGAVESLVTGGADVGFDCGVGQAVTGQISWLPESSPADLTLKGFVSSVDALKQKQK